VRVLQLPLEISPHALAKSKLFPKLSVLELWRNGREDNPAAIELAGLFKSDVGRRLVEIVVRSNLYDVPLELDDWRTTGKRVRFELPYMSATFADDTLEVELRGGGAMRALEIRLELLEHRPRVVIKKAPRGSGHEIDF
jgi:hypothetical protein